MTVTDEFVDACGFRMFDLAEIARTMVMHEHPLRWRKPRRVFVCSLVDLFHEDVPEQFIWQVWDFMRLSPRHTFQVLTKRPERALEVVGRYYELTTSYNPGSGDVRVEYPLRNVWVGVSIENSRYTWRADVLREIPAAVRFVSAEPLLGSLFEGRNDEGSEAVRLSVLQRDDRGHAALLGRREARGRGGVASAGEASVPVAARSAAGPADEGQFGGLDPSSRPVGRGPLDLTGIEWVIIGGEAGPGARPFRLEHAREIIAAARLARQEAHVGGVLVAHSAPAIFVKQLGAKPTDFDERPEDGSRVLSVVEQPLRLRDRKGGDVDEWPVDLRIREFPVSRAVAPEAVSPASRAEV